MNYYGCVRADSARPIPDLTGEAGLPGGKEFDSSYSRGKPLEFALNRVIPCWTEGVQRMKPGGKAKLTCPPGIAYGSRGAGKVIPPDATLEFEVELVGVRVSR